MTLSCTAPRQGHRPGSVAERMCPEHGPQASRQASVAVTAPVSSDKPTVVKRYDDGTIKSEEWRVDGKHHRTDGPAFVQYRPDGTVAFEQWLANGKHHRTDGPARVLYHPDGSIKSESWYVDGKHHRADGPAFVQYHPDGSVESEVWCVNGEWFGGPAPALAALLRPRFPHIGIGAATFLCETRPRQEWADISDAEIELAMTLHPDFTEA